MIYTTSEFLDDIKNEIQKLVGQEVTNLQISKILVGEESRHYESKKTQAKRASKKSKNYLISKEILKVYKKNLKNKFKGDYFDSNLEEIFRIYYQFNNLKEYAKSTLNFNPDLNLDYFETIDSKEKAYWLGWIFAEGHISKRGSLRIEIGLKDEQLLYRFAKSIGFNPDNILYKNRLQNGVEIKTCRITFQNSFFIKCLLNKGLVKGKKSRVIKLPEFGNNKQKAVRELYLAFLLGYFDGDGSQGTSRIFSSSIQFLLQIKKLFNLKTKIGNRKHITADGSEILVYSLFLTADLFNEMLNNFHYSLKRKRIRLVDSKSRAKQLEKTRKMRKEKFMFSKVELQKLLFEMPQTQIVLLHKYKFDIKIGRTTIYRYSKKWKLKKPDPNRWKGLRYEKR